MHHRQRERKLGNPRLAKTQPSFCQVQGLAVGERPVGMGNERILS